jgi:pSer/pThr/pTyr-binding forkhead associated (FHA) protein
LETSRLETRKIAKVKAKEKAKPQTQEKLINVTLLGNNSLKKRFPLRRGITVIGRQEDCDLSIPIQSVSRKHCQLNYEQGVLKIRDLGSRNGTYLNGKPIDKAVIKPGDSVKVGPLSLVFQFQGRSKNITTKPVLVTQSL